VREFNNFKGYKGKYKGLLLTPMEYAQFGEKGVHYVISNRTYYKLFCQFDHMNQDKDFKYYLSEYVITNPLSDNTMSYDRVLKDLYRKLECITLNDYYTNVGDNENTGSCCKSGNFLSDWEYEQKIKLLKDYMHFTKNKDYIRQEMLEEEELLEEEEYHYGEYDDELPF
jgi:hypothetical protein